MNADAGQLPFTFVDVWYYDADEIGWTQIVGVVSADGESVLVAVPGAGVMALQDEFDPQPTLN